MVYAADAYYQADKEKPLLARVPGLVEIGLVKARREVFVEGTVDRMVRPTSIDERLDTSTGRRAMREAFSYVGSDGGEYQLRYKDFHPLELLRLIGFSPVHIPGREVEGSRKVKKHISELREITD